MKEIQKTFNKRTNKDLKSSMHEFFSKSLLDVHSEDHLEMIGDQGTCKIY